MPPKIVLEKSPKSREIDVAGRKMGGGAPVWVESMTKTATADVPATLAQLESLASVGCELVRVALPSQEDLLPFEQIVAKSPLPVVADVHFHHKLAVAACKAGCCGVRINPGNIGSDENIREVVRAAKDNRCHIRVGANSGSVSRELLSRFGGPTAEALVESVRQRLFLVEDMGFGDIIVSIKSTQVSTTLSANGLFRREFDYPLHIGITEAGFGRAGVVRSAVGLALLLAEGLGDSVRVSLTGPPEEEVRAGYDILRALGLREHGVDLISCPTCGRCQVDILAFASQAQEALCEIQAPLRVAVMGCEVNGPGEAREADAGIACGVKMGLLFTGGEVVEKLPNDELIGALVRLVKELAQSKGR